MTYIHPVVLVESTAFSRQAREALPDNQYRLLQLALMARPTLGALIPGSGGLRKLRWALQGRGRRGGARVVYYWKGRSGIIYLLYMYAKSERSDLTRDELRVLREQVGDE